MWIVNLNEFKRIIHIFYKYIKLKNIEFFEKIYDNITERDYCKNKLREMIS